MPPGNRQRSATPRAGGRYQPPSALVIVFTDGVTVEDCYAPRSRLVQYETAPTPWSIKVVNA
jgi:hypothetical protein